MLMKCSVWPDSRQAIAEYKWIESEKVGYDLGNQAIYQWIHKHWCGYLRARWIEHLYGKRYWIELDNDDFGLLKTDFNNNQVLVEAVIDRLKAGQENLEILLWAIDFHIPIPDVFDILDRLNVNGKRISYIFQE